jgi:hypothetical protein
MLRAAWFRISLVSALAAAGLICSARPAEASSIVFNSYSFSGSVTDAMAINPFDPALGTLTSVDVSISGTLSVSGTTSQNMVQSSPGVFVPVPYNYQVNVTQDFFGLAGKYFDFGNPASFTFTGTASGAGGSLAFVTNFGYSFTFDATSDLVGFVLPSSSSTVGILIPPPGGVTGLRSDFLRTNIPLDEIDMIQTWSSQSLFGGVPSPQISSVNSAGVLQITYNYTPTPVPEPSSLALLGLGVTWLAAGRYRRRR